MENGQMEARGRVAIDQPRCPMPSGLTPEEGVIDAELEASGEEVRRADKKRKDKKVGRTHLAYKAKHLVDLRCWRQKCVGESRGDADGECCGSCSGLGKPKALHRRVGSLRFFSLS